MLPLPHGATGVLQHISIDDDRVVALGVQTAGGLTTPLTEISADDGATWTPSPH